MAELHLSDDHVREALQRCEDEPVHSPGVVQPFGCLIALDPHTREIHYASENCNTIIGFEMSDLFGRTVGEIFGRDVEHALNNASAYPAFQTATLPLGDFTINDVDLQAHAFQSGRFWVLELEPHKPAEFGDDHGLKTLGLLIDVIQACDTQQALFDKTVDLMRQLSGYDRVMVYRFDREYNGEVIAEDKRRSMEPFVGLRFPSFDIPAQARDIMKRLPLRFIQNVEQRPVPIATKSSDLGPLDITLAYARGVSPVHMQYLQNMGVQGTMTLSVVVDDDLWGMISFHHQRPRVPSAMLRSILIQVLPVFTTKLKSLQQAEVLDRVKEFESMKDSMFDEMDASQEMEPFFQSIAPAISKAMRADGVAVQTSSYGVGVGQLPGQSISKRLFEMAQASRNKVTTIENFEDAVPELVTDANQIRGALVYATDADTAICFYRRALTPNLKWAGNPDKTIEVSDGRARLSPRGSFAVYLDETSGACEQWTEQDSLFARQIWSIVNAAERRALFDTINRQQKIMIDELNHRVRNILALVRSVSQQARRRYGTLDSYAKSLESRIQALASAHDLSNTKASSVGLWTLISNEAAPYQHESNEQVVLSGEDPKIRSDIAPIFSLIIHELTTNAAKYGALSVEKGKVSVDIAESDLGYVLKWREIDGPAVTTPQDKGFGTVLIEQAVPHELDGTTHLTFGPNGVEAEIVLPHSLFDWSDPTEPSDANAPAAPTNLVEQIGLSKVVLQGSAIVLEDNFVIAKEMSDLLSDFGFQDVQTFSNVSAAVEHIKEEVPTAALLDVSLGGGATSIEAALLLSQLDVAMVFVSGYGEKADLPPELNHVPRLTKPVDARVLKNTLALQFSKLST